MELSARQWSVIRQIAAEQARSVVKKEYNPSPAQEGLQLGFHHSQINEINSIARATALKDMKRARNERSNVVFVQADDALRTANEKLRAEIEELRMELGEANEKLRQADARIQSLTSAGLRVYHSTCPIDFKHHDLRDGDVCLTSDEKFTYFRGQWRRKSELEAYASAAQYL